MNGDGVNGGTDLFKTSPDQDPKRYRLTLSKYLSNPPEIRSRTLSEWDVTAIDDVW